MDRRRDQTAADTDRSEIGPYLGSPRTTSGGQKNINSPNPLQPVPKNHPCSLPPNHPVPKQQRDRAGASIEGDQTLPLARSAKALPSSAFSASAGTVSRPPTHVRTHAPTPTPTEPHITHRSEGITRTPSTSRSKRRPYSTKLAFNAASDGGTATPLASWNTATM